MISTELAVAAAIVTALVGFALGWDWSVHKYRADKKQLEATTADLETELATLHALAARDPQRAWIDIGKTNILAHVERLLIQLRSKEPPS